MGVVLHLTRSMAMVLEQERLQHQHQQRAPHELTALDPFDLFFRARLARRPWPVECQHRRGATVQAVVLRRAAGPKYFRMQVSLHLAREVRLPHAATSKSQEQTQERSSRPRPTAGYAHRLARTE